MSMISQERMDTIGTYMDDNIREQVHYELAPCTPEEFLIRYLDLDPVFEMVLWSEFSICMTYEESHAGEIFTLEGMRHIYNKEVDHSEYDIFNDWLHDMVRSGVFECVYERAFI